MIATYRARRRLRIGDGFREPGELVPEAVTWFRVQTLVHAGNIVEVEVSEQEMTAAIAQYCPQLGDKIAELTGLDGTLLSGPRHSPIPGTSRKRPSRAKQKPEPVGDPEPAADSEADSVPADVPVDVPVATE